MIKAGLFASTALPFLFAGLGVAAAAAEQRNAAAPHPLHPKFRAHLKCPYADQWLTKGAKQAALELGLDEHGRKLEESSMQQNVQGSCSYTNAFSGGMTCMQFTGTAWTEADMQTRCAQESGALSAEGCSVGSAGWCTKMIADEKHEATVMELSAMADCDGSEMACKSFMGGTFMAGGQCLTATTASEETGENMFGGAGGPPPGVATGGTGGAWPGAGAATGEDSPTKCLIAPGAIGAAHQAGYSDGYSNSCPGTPGQESPYMWPLKWSAETESHAMKYGSDDVTFHSKAKVYYMLDKNWKRLDMMYQKGVLNGLGQGPCDEEDQTDFAMMDSCAKNQTEDNSITTMIHRGGLMYFIDWMEDETNPVKAGELDATKIESCQLINLAVIGNIRPDWFMDKRGDDTDVQYLGDQHVYYADGQLPKLVKQWRKKDFASQYFIMSMMGNPANKLEKDPDAPIEDNINWPLILNVPGEGFGDDSLQVYRNHELLTDGEDEELFKLIEAYEAVGGVCAEISRPGEESGPSGPLAEGTVPSDLEVDPLSWVSNEITFSPIWEVPTKEYTADESPSSSSSGKSVLEVSDRLTVESCYDESTQSLDMSIHFHDVEPAGDGLLPWMAVGYRPSDLCAMTPPEGGVTPMVLVTQASEDAAPEAHKTSLLPEAKRFDDVAFSSMYTLMRPLGDIDGYNNVSVEAPMVSADIKVARTSFVTEDTVSLHFKQEVEGKPDVMNLMFAIGGGSQLGFHTVRGCFQVQATPCGGGSSMDTENLTIDLSGGEENEEKTVDLLETDKSSANVVFAGITFALASVVGVMIGL
ncbi:hypothetical protein ACHAXR_010642 [Thalassiosira sp. AJA248-18]